MTTKNSDQSASQAAQPMVQISYYVPESHLEVTKQALFDAGAGRIGNYDCCAWQTLGQGQFRPLPGSKPAIGDQHSLERLNEYKVELICERRCLSEAIQALKKAHLYEEPAFFITAWDREAS